MSKNGRSFTITIVWILCILLAISCRKEPGMGVGQPDWGSLHLTKNILGELLLSFFSYEEKPAAITKQYFIEYATEKGIFATFPPPQGYETEGDLSFYLIWPEKLKSTNPQLVAYTQPFNKANEKDLSVKCRCLLFFCENEPVAIVMNRGEADILIGTDNIRNNKPDLYLWPKYDDYKRDEKAKKTKTAADANSKG